MGRTLGTDTRRYCREGCGHQIGSGAVRCASCTETVTQIGLLPSGDLSWRRRGLCWGTSDQRVFPPEGRQYSPEIKKARARFIATKCRHCPVKRECLVEGRGIGRAFGLLTSGVWGGIDFQRIPKEGLRDWQRRVGVKAA